tara:strand:- start:1622 stop:2146 length:525 start_codon:yes stop_codon:yes gene_type:complete
MAKISNTSAYPNISSLDNADYLILTDAENQLKTKTCTIEQLQVAFGIDTLIANVVINPATLQALGTSSKQLIPAPGAGKVIDIISTMAYLEAGVSQYNFGAVLSLKQGAYTWGTIANTFVNKAASGSYKYLPQYGHEAPANTAVVLDTASNPGQGDGTLYLNIYYRVLTQDSSF